MSAQAGGALRGGRLLRVVGGLVGLVVLVVLAVLPLLSGTSNATLLTLTLMLTSIGVAVNWNLTGGFTGYVDFGHAVWFGIGAYATAILISLQPNGPQVGWHPVPAIVVGALVAGVLAAAIGRATMRLKGPYFSIAMLGTFVAVREIVRVWSPLTGGGVGLTLPPYLNRQLFYYVELALVVLLVSFTWWLRRTRFGAALVAIREDEIGAETRGIDTTRLKTAIFSFAGLSTGLFGALWAYQNTFVDPDIAFVEVRTIDAVMGTMLGGLGTVAGPVLGAAALYWLREVLWANLLDYHLLTQGVLLIVVVLFVPRGLVGLVDRRGASLAEVWGWKGRRRGGGAADRLTEEGLGDSAAAGPAGGDRDGPAQARAGSEPGSGAQGETAAGGDAETEALS
ncbi:MAG: branched-chain amino acid ABC transporter permease [bacterium]|nr:branched-chain amino acid ABC transporter permease [bacterium]